VARAHPRAGAIGCAVVGHAEPHPLQAADFHPIPPQLCGSGFVDYRERFFLHDNCIDQRDLGLFRYTRPCLSVTGCCHLLRREAVEAAGAFDVRFSPSQFDDLERDIRSFLAGFPSVYHGQLRVEHIQRSSMAQASSRGRQAHILGNKLKLECLYSDEQADTVAREANQRLFADLRAKLAFLDQATEELGQATIS